MMDFNTSYRHYRWKGYPASCAIHYARQLVNQSEWLLDWEAVERGDLIQQTRWEQSGFTLIASVVMDECPDTSYLGEFSDSPDEDAIPHEHGNHRTYDWFNPMISLEAHRKELRKSHSRHEAYLLARSYVIDTYERAVKCGSEWNHVGVRVQVFRAGIELADESLWGIESDAGDDYFSEVAQDLAEQGITNAEMALSKLCSHH